MRSYHRWLSVLFGLFILWIAATGVLSQIGTLVNNGGFEEERMGSPATPAATLIPTAQAHESQPAAATTAPTNATPAFFCPADMTCRPKRTPKPGDWNVSYLHHLHSGEEFGPAGVIVSLASGLALLFFAFSGLYMYIQMFRARAGRTTRGGRFFW